MRLLFVGTLFPSSTNPVRATYNLQHLTAVARLGHSVEVIAPVPWFPGLDWLRGHPCPPRTETVASLSVTHPRFLYTPGLLIDQHHRMYRAGLRRPLAVAVRRFRPDVALLAFAYPDAAAVAPLCRELGLPWAVAVLGSDFRVRMRQPALRRLVLDTLQAAPVVVCPGQALRRDLLSAGLAPERVVAFNNGVDHALFTPSAADARSPTVLAVGGLLPVKGHDRLLAAWAMLRSRVPTAARLVLIGDGPRRAALVSQAARLGIARSVEFLGARPHLEVADWLRRVHCLCLPSRSEGMPNVVLEALACGTPVVATDVGEVPFLVRTGENGDVVANREQSVAADLAAALARVLARSWNPETVSALVANFTWEGAADTLVTTLARATQTPLG